MHKLSRQMSARQLIDWMDYASYEPFGEERADLRSAQVTSAIYNVNRDPKKKKEPFTLSDVMLRFGPQEKKKKVVDWQRMKSLAKSFAKPDTEQGKTRSHK